jgi:hypothetical protein
MPLSTFHRRLSRKEKEDREEPPVTGWKSGKIQDGDVLSFINLL